MVSSDHIHMSENTETHIKNADLTIREIVKELMEKLSDNEEVKGFSSGSFLLATAMAFISQSSKDKETRISQAEELFKEAIEILKNYD